MERKELETIFEKLKKLLMVYKGEMITLIDNDSRYELAAKGDYDVTSKKTGRTTKKKEPYFAGLIIQSSYVGIYNCGIYLEPEKIKKEHSELIDKTLKGKSCFHIKEYSNEVEEMVKYVFAETYSQFDRNNWLG